jgi:hypothetical protein
MRSDTPWEFALYLTARIERISERGIFRKFVAGAQLEIKEFTLVYTQMLYSPRIVGGKIHGEMIALWRRLRRRLLFASVLQIFTQEKHMDNLGEHNGEPK